jgi:hypothetical protein
LYTYGAGKCTCLVIHFMVWESCCHAHKCEQTWERAGQTCEVVIGIMPVGQLGNGVQWVMSGWSNCRPVGHLSFVVPHTCTGNDFCSEATSGKLWCALQAVSHIQMWH